MLTAPTVSPGYISTAFHAEIAETAGIYVAGEQTGLGHLAQPHIIAPSHCHWGRTPRLGARRSELDRRSDLANSRIMSRLIFVSVPRGRA